FVGRILEGHMFRKFVSSVIAVAMGGGFGAFIGVRSASASTLPSGQRMANATTFDSVSGQFVGGGGSVEPAYDDVTGTIIYLWTPNKARVHPNAHNVAPLYLRSEERRVGKEGISGRSTAPSRQKHTWKHDRNRNGRRPT